MARDTVRPPWHRMAGGHQELLRPPLRRFWVLRAETLQPEPDHPRLPLPHGRPSCWRVPLAAGRRGALPGTVPRPRPRCCSALGGAAATHPHSPLSPASAQPRGGSCSSQSHSCEFIFPAPTPGCLCALGIHTLHLWLRDRRQRGPHTRLCSGVRRLGQTPCAAHLPQPRRLEGQSPLPAVGRRGEISGEPPEATGARCLARWLGPAAAA